MSVATIETELGKMTNAERLAVIGVATKLIKTKPNKNRKPSREEKRSKLKESAELMRDEYSTNKSLTDLTNLDGEDFLDV